tara:strand:- start:2819 stop:3907 length:1089 start_codon:yes stop_codon:yes gene_type:complete
MPFKNLPKPDGNYIIGTDVFILEDFNRDELFTPNPNDFRKIIVQAWYPAIDQSDSIYPYLDFPDIRIPFIAKRVGISEKMIKHINNIKANAYYKALPINKEFPIIIFSHGLGGNRTQNSINAESLASNGYTVFAIEHTYDANITVFNDSTYYEFNSYLADTVSKEKFYETRIPQINTRAKDILFLIDKITSFKKEGFYIGRMSDINRIGVFGHSFGGGTAVVSSYMDSRIDACLNLDGWFEPIPMNIINNGIDIPFCYIGQIQKDWDGAPFNEMQLIKFHNNSSNSDIIEVQNTKHFDYADIPYVNKSSRIMGLAGKASKNITLDLSKTINDFFNMHLKNDKKDWTQLLKNNYNVVHNIDKK